MNLSKWPGLDDLLMPLAARPFANLDVPVPPKKEKK
jgi:hypothetical protein